MQEIRYNIYNDVALKILNNEVTLKRIKIKFEDELSKSVLKENTSSPLAWAQHAHANNLWYPITIFNNNKPEVYISYGSEYIVVSFLDKRLFEIMSLTYKKVDENRLFLMKIYLREYNGIAQKPLQDLKNDKKILFTEDGSLTVTTNEFIRNETVTVVEDIVESAEKVNVSHNWIEAPAFGNYDSLCEYNKILKKGDLLQKI
ncbi:hypothetical protein BBH99_08850 [Chryseobacterium contaminans]|uniref:Uncharacterized protein n=1 Tax=Chryseobacterium contaminans TaxID=1423959 RepID=A0A1M6YG86_9FLAO|nr:hypothetical protein [Chryseobacterium contaminans]OCA78322.1 hypothetical protein BBH99_08850 [Chryseobacterium contaminans]SHL17162.1 hypothetical protein SAMN05444407_102501 [Chryseobacterium contaminans]